MAPTTEISTWCSLARSPTWSDRPRIEMRKTARSRSVAVSFGSLAPKVIFPSGRRIDPAAIASPSTRSAFAKSEPRIENWATTTSPAESAKRTMNSSGRFPSVDWSAPVTAGPNRAPTDSVAMPIVQATPPSAAPVTTKVTTGSAPAKWRTADDRDGEDDRRPRVRHGSRESLTNPIRSYIAASVGADAARALSAPTASRRSSSGSSARSSRYRSRTGSEQLDHRLPDIALEVAVPRPVVRPLDLLGRAVGRDREDVDEVRHAGLVVAPAGPRVPSRSPPSGTSSGSRRARRGASPSPARCRRSSTSSSSAPGGP